jgi:hypothetical protein
MAETKVAAELALDAFIESHALKYEKAADCLSKDRARCLLSTTSRPSTGNTCRRRMRLTSAFFVVVGILRCAGNLVAKCGAPAESAAGRSYSCLAGLRRPRAFSFGERGR